MSGLAALCAAHAQARAQGDANALGSADVASASTVQRGRGGGVGEPSDGSPLGRLCRLFFVVYVVWRLCRVLPWCLALCVRACLSMLLVLIAVSVLVAI